jgi:hypothetical protein
MSIEIAPEEYRVCNINWDAARLYCFSLNIDGKVGWRLPTVDELTGKRREFDLDFDDPSVWVWTIECTSDDDATIVDLTDFEKLMFDKTDDDDVWVYPVRDVCTLK